MKNALFIFLLAGGMPAIIFSQTAIPIPPVLESATIDLNMQKSTSEIYPGIQTQTIGYNGAQLGPTLILHKGQMVTLNVHNQLADTTTTHWHGLHIAAKNDGSPHMPILAGETWSPSFEVMDHAATYWYHPHPHGSTLKQVVKGAAGFIIVRDDEEAALNLPRTYGVDDIPLVFQWKTFDSGKQIVEKDELDNEILINGVLRGSTLSLPAQVVRLRLLNGSSHRYFDFGFTDNSSFKQIGGDGGLLDAPVSLTKLLLAPGERAEILVDLSGRTGQSLTLRQYGTQLPQGYPGGQMMMMGGNSMMGPLDNTDFDIMKIAVTMPTPGAITSIPAILTSNAVYPQSGTAARAFSMSAQPMMSMTNFYINNVKFDMETMNFSTEVGKTEIWTITNQTMMAHPFHVHGNSFYVLSVNGAAPPANMRGRKDVITIPPMNGMVKIIIRFEDFSDPDMPYMYHCHILSHEDTGMMGQFIVNAAASATGEVEPNSSCPICISSLTLPTGIDLARVTSTDLFDLAGQLIRHNNTTGSLGKQVDVSQLPVGAYFLVMYDKAGNILATQRFVKQ